MAEKIAIIIGAGPAGLTAAYELLEKSDVKPVIFEMSDDIGGISKTVEYKGNRMDIGGHRFFSKSQRVVDFWKKILPVMGAPAKDDLFLGRKVTISSEKDSPNPEKTDKVMLLRGRLSRIFFLRKFFAYPISLSVKTLANLGIVRTIKIGFSYLKVRIFPIKIEKNLEDFFVNRFGRELYLTFFKDYTEKVWGVPCKEISPDWGAQRIKGLSITKAVWHAIRSVFKGKKSLDDKSVETSLIEEFMYPKFGPGQLWETVAEIVRDKGGEIFMNTRVVRFKVENGKVVGVVVKNLKTGEEREVSGDYFISTMPVCELVEGLGEMVSSEVSEVAHGLKYRDFMTVGLLLKKMKIKNETSQKSIGDVPPDNWIYIQERDVKIGRLQVFNNWSPYMVRDLEKTVWLGLEYFCNVGDELWSMNDDVFAKFAIGELAKIDIIEESDVLDSVVVRMEKAYPSYFGAYGQFDKVRGFVDRFENLFLIGRNGMHRYNNQDHSMMTAMVAVENIVAGRVDKANIWDVNVEKEYHEKK